MRACRRLAAIAWMASFTVNCSLADSPASDASPESTQSTEPAEPDAHPGKSGLATPAAESGRWQRLPKPLERANLEPEQREMIERLEALGYADGTIEDDRHGLTVNHRALTSDGLNLYSSGHAPEAILMDMDGNVLHTWRYSLHDALPHVRSRKVDWYRRIHLYDNGDLLAIFEGRGIIKLDRNSQLLWASPLRAHHDLEVMPSGDIYVLSRIAHMIPRLSEESPILEDYISVLGPDGTEKRRVSLLQAVEDSRFSHLLSHSDLDAERGPLGDVFHTNTLEVLDGSLAHELPAFRNANVLISMLKLDAIGVIDMQSERMVWAMKGAFRAQHDPAILQNGHLLLFDNEGTPGRSVVTELDPGSHRVVWQYRGSEEAPFFSKTCGSAQRLPNGNTLITESDYGRAFEVTPQHEIVWEFYNPHRAGESEEFIAALFEMLRLPPDFPTDWLSDAPP